MKIVRKTLLRSMDTLSSAWNLFVIKVYLPLLKSEVTPQKNIICLQFTFVCIFYLTFSHTKPQIATNKNNKKNNYVFQLSIFIQLAAPSWSFGLYFFVVSVMQINLLSSTIYTILSHTKKLKMKKECFKLNQ